MDDDPHPIHIHLVDFQILERQQQVQIKSSKINNTK
nr:multicopper oxidase domain-containing protein [Psychrobacillus sp. INOP01]